MLMMVGFYLPRRICGKITCSARYNKFIFSLSHEFNNFQLRLEIIIKNHLKTAKFNTLSI